MTTFDDIVGHEQPLRLVRSALKEGRLHHSLLFHGPEGVGKRTVALLVAAALNCVRTGGTDTCGACAACHRVGKGLHPDVAVVTLERTMIPIDAIRSLRQEASYRPYEGRRRVFIVDPADRMSIDAQNALLKTLEEPPASSALILVTTRPMHLLPTTAGGDHGPSSGAPPGSARR
jgi:DNA polymerase-3 subunit delta'